MEEWFISGRIGCVLLCPEGVVIITGVHLLLPTICEHESLIIFVYG